MSRTIGAIAFSPDNEKIAATTDRVNVGQVRNLLTNSIVELVSDAGTIITTIEFSPNSQIIATTILDGLTQLWDLSGNIILSVSHDAGQTSVSFSPDRLMVAILDSSERVQVWNIEEHKLTLDFKKTTPGRLAKKIEFSPNGNFLILKTSKYAELRNLSGELITKFANHKRTEIVTFSLNGQFLAISDGDTIDVWDLWEEKPIDTLKVNYWITEIAFLPDFRRDNQALTFSTNNCGQTTSVWLWHWQRSSYCVELITESSPCPVFFSFNKANSKIVIKDSDSLVKVWDVFEWGGTPDSIKHFGLLEDVIFKPDGSMFATVDPFLTAQLWNISEIFFKSQVLNISEKISEVDGQQLFSKR